MTQLNITDMPVELIQQQAKYLLIQGDDESLQAALSMAQTNRCFHGALVGLNSSTVRALSLYFQISGVDALWLESNNETALRDCLFLELSNINPWEAMRSKLDDYHENVNELFNVLKREKEYLKVKLQTKPVYWFNQLDKNQKELYIALARGDKDLVLKSLQKLSPKLIKKYLFDLQKFPYLTSAIENRIYTEPGYRLLSYFSSVYSSEFEFITRYLRELFRDKQWIITQIDLIDQNHHSTQPLCSTVGDNRFDQLVPVNNRNAFPTQLALTIIQGDIVDLCADMLDHVYCLNDVFRLMLNFRAWRCLTYYLSSGRKSFQLANAHGIDSYMNNFVDLSVKFRKHFLEYDSILVSWLRGPKDSLETAISSASAYELYQFISTPFFDDSNKNICCVFDKLVYEKHYNLLDLIVNRLPLSFLTKKASAPFFEYLIAKENPDLIHQLLVSLAEEKQLRLFAELITEKNLFGVLLLKQNPELCRALFHNVFNDRVHQEVRSLFKTVLENGDFLKSLSVCDADKPFIGLNTLCGIDALFNEQELLGYIARQPVIRQVLCYYALFGRDTLSRWTQEKIKTLDGLQTLFECSDIKYLVHYIMLLPEGIASVFFNSLSGDVYKELFSVFTNVLYKSLGESLDSIDLLRKASGHREMTPEISRRKENVDATQKREKSDHHKHFSSLCVGETRPENISTICNIGIYKSFFSRFKNLQDFAIFLRGVSLSQEIYNQWIMFYFSVFFRSSDSECDFDLVADDHFVHSLIWLFQQKEQEENQAAVLKDRTCFQACIISLSEKDQLTQKSLLDIVISSHHWKLLVNLMLFITDGTYDTPMFNRGVINDTLWNIVSKLIDNEDLRRIKSICKRLNHKHVEKNQFSNLLFWLFKNAYLAGPNAELSIDIIDGLKKPHYIWRPIEKKLTSAWLFRKDFLKLVVKSGQYTSIRDFSNRLNEYCNELSDDEFLDLIKDFIRYKDVSCISKIVHLLNDSHISDHRFFNLLFWLFENSCRETNFSFVEYSNVIEKLKEKELIDHCFQSLFITTWLVRKNSSEKSLFQVVLESDFYWLLQWIEGDFSEKLSEQDDEALIAFLSYSILENDLERIKTLGNILQKRHIGRCFKDPKITDFVNSDQCCSELKEFLKYKPSNDFSIVVDEKSGNQDSVVIGLAKQQFIINVLRVKTNQSQLDLPLVNGSTLIDDLLRGFKQGLLKYEQWISDENLHKHHRFLFKSHRQQDGKDRVKAVREILSDTAISKAERLIKALESVMQVPEYYPSDKIRTHRHSLATYVLNGMMKSANSGSRKSLQGRGGLPSKGSVGFFAERARRRYLNASITVLKDQNNRCRSVNT